MPGRTNVQISPYPGHPEATEAMRTGSERMSWKYPGNYGDGYGHGYLGDIGDVSQISTPPTPSTMIGYLFNLVTSSPLTIALIGGALLAVYYLGKEER